MPVPLEALSPPPGDLSALRARHGETKLPVEAVAAGDQPLVLALVPEP